MCFKLLEKKLYVIKIISSKFINYWIFTHVFLTITHLDGKQFSSIQVTFGQKILLYSIYFEKGYIYTVGNKVESRLGQPHHRLPVKINVIYCV